jgi:DNA-binding SARP family transcriptional activator
MGAFRLLLLGPPRVEKDGQAIPIVLRKAVALVAYLAVEQRAFSREHLATLLWADHGQAGAMANLRRTLSFLRERFGHGCLAAAGDQLQIDRGTVTVDVDEFLSLIASRDRVPDLRNLEAAAALYRGSFLEGFSLRGCLEFDDWQDAARESLRSEYDGALEKLTGGYLRDGQLGKALPVARRWLGLDPLNEAAHRALMEIYGRLGRMDRAHRQYETCKRALAREGLEPEPLTSTLVETMEKRRLGSAPAEADAAVDLPGARPHGKRHAFLRRRWRWIAAAALVLIATVVANLYFLRFRIYRSDVSVTGVEISRSGEELSAIRAFVRNDGPARWNVDYSVVFSSDAALVAAREYVVYRGELRMGRNAEVEVSIDPRKDIRGYLDAHDVAIPPGDYTVGVVIDPEWKAGDSSRLNNRLAGSDRFFFPGTAPMAAFGVEIRCRGTEQLDPGNPLKVFIGDRTVFMGAENVGRFVVTREGRYHFPVEDLPRRDNDGSGYFLVIARDAGNDMGHPMFPGPGDVAALYRQVPGGLVYGVFGVGLGSPIHPGGSYIVEFSPPPKPQPDAFEIDDVRNLGTLVSSGRLPLRQRHTFHDEGTGDTDEDWFRIRLGAGESLTVETFSAGGPWECDTAIDISGERTGYIRTVKDKAQDDMYAVLAYVNDTGIDQVFHILVKPYGIEPSGKYDPGVNRIGEYIVEFRD